MKGKQLVKKKQITKAEVKEMQDIETYTFDEKKCNSNSHARMAYHNKATTHEL